MKNGLKNKVQFVLVFITLFNLEFANAQAPQKLSYQAVIRNTSTVLVTSTTIGMRISIVQATSTKLDVYIETQTIPSNVNGLISLEIGMGTKEVIVYKTN